MNPADDPGFVKWMREYGALCLTLNPLINSSAVVNALYAAYLAGRADGYEAGEEWLQHQRDLWLRN